MVEMMLMQNAQMHQILMQNLMLKALPPVLAPAGLHPALRVGRGASRDPRLWVALRASLAPACGVAVKEQVVHLGSREPLAQALPIAAAPSCLYARARHHWERVQGKRPPS